MKKNNKGFVILFAVPIAAILLAVALGVSNIALKEVNFSTSAKDTNNAFFAADTGLEYVLFRDKPPVSSYPTPAAGTSTTFPPVILYGLGTGGFNCVIVTVTKNNITPPVRTTIISKGYNRGGDNASCTSSSINRIEREIKVSY